MLYGLETKWALQLDGGVGGLVNVLPQSQDAAFGRGAENDLVQPRRVCSASETNRRANVQGLKSITVESTEFLQGRSYFLILSLRLHGTSQKHEAVAAIPTHPLIKTTLIGNYA